MKVLSVSSEIFPLVKTGGLADVTGALPDALKAEGVTMTSFVPGYPAVLAALARAETVHSWTDLFGGPARILQGQAAGLDLFVLDAPHLFDRPGNPYLGPDGHDWPDNADRFAAFSLAAAELARGVVKGFQPDVLQLHDWQAALAGVYVRFLGGAPTLLTVHNIAFQGVFPAEQFSRLGLPPEAFTQDGLEYYGSVGYLKGGLACVDRISTVSPTYAMEIMTPEFGMGLDGLLRARRTLVSGIVNGIDTGVWSPETDPLIAQAYSAKTLKNRSANKRALEKKLGLEPGDGILHGVISRMTAQKGLDILADVADGVLAGGARLAIIGTGDTDIEGAFLAASERYPGRIGTIFSYHEDAAHLMQAGADTILVPSRFEPCGLTQLCGLHYGCIPVVARTGGLADTVIDANEAALLADVATGLQFSPVTGLTLENALARAAHLYKDRALWQRMQKRAMTADVSWGRSAAAYARLYQTLVRSS